MWGQTWGQWGHTHVCVTPLPHPREEVPVSGRVRAQLCPHVPRSVPCPGHTHTCPCPVPVMSSRTCVHTSPCLAMSVPSPGHAQPCPCPVTPLPIALSPSQADARPLPGAVPARCPPLCPQPPRCGQCQPGVPSPPLLRVPRSGPAPRVPAGSLRTRGVPGLGVPMPGVPQPPPGAAAPRAAAGSNINRPGLTGHRLSPRGRAGPPRHPRHKTGGSRGCPRAPEPP